MALESFKEIKKLATIKMVDDTTCRRVEIIMLKFRESREIIDTAISRIIHNTDWPFKLTIFDNRLNTPNTSRAWNKLTWEATCNNVLIIDSDAFVPVRKDGEKCWLTRMMESIDETGIVIPVSTAPGGAHQHVTQADLYPSTSINKDAWSGFCFLFDRERVWNADRFDERFYIYGQDSEWSVRTGRKYGGAVMRQDVLVEHIGGASFKSNPIRDEDKLYARELFRYITNKS